MIKLEKINKYYYRHKKNQIHVIDNTSLDFGDSGLVALLGPSGCGKTTLLNVIGGLDRVSNGKIYINGKKITKKSSNYIDKIRNINIGYIFQDYCLVDTMTVFDNVALSLKIIGIKNKEEIKKRVEYVLEKVGMYRYRNRFASMLSGGERQRVGIARAIVKDPNIIIADEPTGNLDSKNSLEVMNIIKAISKDRLVILVTHENDLAEFYASRILDISDGKIVNDRKNDHTNDLDYRLDNRIYLKDFENHESVSNENVNIDYYSDSKTKLDVDIVVQNGNIYIKAKSSEKLEVLDDDSSIELVDDHYKKISKTIYEEYNFELDKIINKDIKKKYSSIFNPISLLINGFKKVRDYSIPKKILLAGFFISGVFIMNSISNVFGITNIKDEDFIKTNRNYLKVISNKINIDKYLEYEKDENIKYIIPGSSIINLTIKYTDYYQTSNTTDSMSGSLVDIDTITENDIVLGKYPENSNEIVLDRMVITNYLSSNTPKQMGIFTEEDLIGRTLSIGNIFNLTLVGIVDKKDPSIYASKDGFIEMIRTSQSNNDYEMYSSVRADNSSYEDFNYVLDDIYLVKGNYPTNDYEVILNESQIDNYKLNKEIDSKINDKKLVVVGFYGSTTISDKLLVNSSTIKYDLLNNTENYMIYSNNKEETIDTYKQLGLNIEDTYTFDKGKYINEKKDYIITCLIICAVTLLISLIEIFLMIRSSFLSRIKEIGIYRAIGMKKKDIRKMFLGEIIAITTLSSLVGIILMSYIIIQLTKLKYFQNTYYLNPYIFIGVVVFAYLFNIIIGLLPVNNVLRQTPAKILSRTDL